MSTHCVCISIYFYTYGTFMRILYYDFLLKINENIGGCVKNHVGEPAYKIVINR